MKDPWEEYAAPASSPWEAYSPVEQNVPRETSRRTYVQPLAEALEQNKLFGSATAAVQEAKDKGIRRREDGDWDLPALTLTDNDSLIDSTLSTVKGVGTLLSQKAGSRLRPQIVGDEYKRIQKVFHEFQQANNLSDEEVQAAWSDLGNVQRPWGEDEKLRVLSNGTILPNPNDSDWLDNAKAADLIREADAPDAAKAAALRGLPQIQNDMAFEKVGAYEAGTTISNMGKDILPFGGVASDVLTPSKWGEANSRDDVGSPAFVRDYEAYLETVPALKRKAAGLSGRTILGFNKVATTALGLAGMMGSDAAGQLAAESSEGASKVRQGMEPTGLAGTVVEEVPSVVTQVLTGRLLGLGAGALTKSTSAAQKLTGLGVFGSAGLQSAGLTYADEIAQGTPEDEAREKAAKAGVSTTLVTAMFGTGAGGGVERIAAGEAMESMTLSQMFKFARENGLKNLAKSPELRKIAAGALGEGAEEGIDQLLQSFLTADPDTSLADAWSGAVEAAKVGGVIGGAVEVGQRAARDLAMSALPEAPEAAKAAMEPIGEDQSTDPTRLEVGEDQPVDLNEDLNPPVTPSETRRGEESETDASSPAFSTDEPLPEQPTSENPEVLPETPIEEAPTTEVEVEPSPAPTGTEPTEPLPEGTAAPETGAAGSRIVAAALKDPQTGRIFTGATHGFANPRNLSLLNLDTAEDPQDFIGFVDENGQWVSSSDAEERFGVDGSEATAAFLEDPEIQQEYRERYGWTDQKIQEEIRKRKAWEQMGLPHPVTGDMWGIDMSIDDPPAEPLPDSPTDLGSFEDSELRSKEAHQRSNLANSEIGPELNALEDKWEKSGVKLRISETKEGGIDLEVVKVPEADRRRGVGSRVISDLKTLADRTRKPVELIPVPLGDGTIEDLEKFYAKNGFEPYDRGTSSSGKPRQRGFRYTPKDEILPDSPTDATPEPGSEPAVGTLLPPPSDPPDFSAALEDDSVTGLYHAQSDADRARLGLPPRFTQPRTTDQVAWDAATAAEDAHRAAGKPGTAGTDLLNSLLVNEPRVLTKEEHALMLHEKLIREQFVEQAQSALNALPETASDGDRKNAQAAVKKAQDEFDLLLTYADAAGSLAGLSLQARKMLANRDYSLAAVVNRLKAAKNLNSDKPVEWTEADQKKAVELAQKLQQAEERINALESENSEQILLVEQLTKDVERAQKKLENRIRGAKPKAKIKEKLDPMIEAARARIKARKQSTRGQLMMAMAPTPEMLADLKDYTIIAAGLLVDKSLTLQEFSARLISEFGDWIAEHVEYVFRQARSFYIETAESVAGNEAPSPEKVLENLDAESPLDRKAVWDLARAHVIAGLRGRNVLDAVFGDLLKKFPGVTRDQVAELFTGYGRVIYPSKNEAQKELQRIRSIERNLLKLADIRAGRIPKRTGLQRGDQDAEVRELEKQVREALRESGLQVTDPETQLRTSLATAKRRIQNEIEEIEQAIREETPRTVNPRASITPDEELVSLREQLEAKRGEYNAVFREESAREKRLLASAKKRKEELQRRIKELDFSKKPKPEPLNTEAKRKADYELAKLKSEYEELRNQYALARAPIGKKVAHYAISGSNLLKLMVLGTDVGVVFRQLRTTFQALTRDMGMLAPTEAGAKKRADGSYLKKIFTAGVKAFGDPEYEHAAYEEMLLRPNAGWDKTAGLVLNAPFDVRQNSKEDIPPANLLDKIPWWMWPAIAGAKVYLLGMSFPAAATIIALGSIQKPLLQALDRAQRTMTNQSRVLFFDEFMDSVEKPTVEEAKAIAKAVMVGTGRGTATQKIEAAIPLLNVVLLSTRYYLSNWQAVTLYPLLNKDARSSPRARKHVAKMYARSLTGTATLMAFAAMAFGKAFSGDEEDDKEGVSTDPFNPNFGGLNTSGKTRIDLTGGRAQWIGFLARYFWKVRTDPDTGRKVALGGGYRNNVNDEARKFLVSKLNIPVSLFARTHAGQLYGGKPATLPNILDEATSAIIVNDTVNVYKTMMEEYGPEKGAARASVFLSLMFLGAGTTVYDTEEQRAVTQAARKEAEWERKKREARLNE